MEKDALISSLKEKAGVDNISERSYDEVATLFSAAFSDDSKITDESWTIPVQMLKTMSGQLRHDTSVGINDFKTRYESEQKTAQEKAIADAIAAAKTEWEKAKKDAEPKPTEQTTEADITKLVSEKINEAMRGLTGEDSEFGKLSKQFSDYLKMQAAKEKAATEENVRSQVREYLLGRGVEEDDFALDYTLEKLIIGDNPDVSALKTKAEKDYESNYKKIHKRDGALPFNGGMGGGTKSVVQEIEAWSKTRQAAADSEAAATAELEKHIFR